MKMIDENKNYLHDCDCDEHERKHCHDDFDCRRPNRKHCFEECFIVKRPCSCAPTPGKSLLRCSTGSARPLPEIDTLLPNPIPVGSITIDTRELCNPTVLLNFNAIITNPSKCGGGRHHKDAAPAPGGGGHDPHEQDIEATLTFTVFKCCDGCTQPVGESFTFSATLDELSSQSFSFQVCDCSNCCGCETYTVQITNATLTSPGLIVRAQISALAVENIC